jgi:hypothetical protein
MPKVVEIDPETGLPVVPDPAFEETNSTPKPVDKREVFRTELYHFVVHFLSFLYACFSIFFSIAINVLTYIL